MKKSISQLVHDIRNMLQAHWTLVDMVEIPLEGDLVVQAELAKAKGALILEAFDQIVEVADKQMYTEDDMKAAHRVGYAAGIHEEKGIVDEYKSVVKWLQDYNESK